MRVTNTEATAAIRVSSRPARWARAMPASNTGRSTSQASRTSAVVSDRSASSTPTLRSAKSRNCSSQASLPVMALAKIVGVVVTPTTCRSVTNRPRFPVG